MAALLSFRDMGVLEKIKDPESNPAAGPLIEPSLPKDPNITDNATYQRVVQRERDVVLNMQRLEQQLARMTSPPTTEHFAEYQAYITTLDDLILEFPNYASARNNRVQALRSLYGDHLLMKETPEVSKTAFQVAVEVDPSTMPYVRNRILTDLDAAIHLLSPRILFSGISPTAANTLSTAYTQRAAVYHTTSKSLGGGGMLDLDSSRRESTWSAVDFEEAASHDFAMGGRYGNEIAKGLAVSTNPTAKLCGQMVREMMKKEYGESI